MRAGHQSGPELSRPATAAACSKLCGLLMLFLVPITAAGCQLLLALVLLLLAVAAVAVVFIAGACLAI